MNNQIDTIKKEQLKLLSDYRKQLYVNPVLKFLFLELTLRCNERCLHCGSSCGDVPSNELTFDQYRKILEDVAADFDVRSFQLCITGGEPLLRRDFFDILGHARDLGYHWGMTSNGTLITKEVAHRLALAGMGTISISVDGLEGSHDSFRQTPGGWKKALAGVENLIEEGAFRHVQITSVMNHTNIHELEEMYRLFENIDIDSWRVIGIEPMGRALLHPELLLTDDDQRYLFSFIRDKRMADVPVTYGCSHFLGMLYERETRGKYFTCNAGIYTASIFCNGDIGACLDIERRPELVQGNILRDNFKDVWENRFEFYRQPLARLNETCSACEVKDFCNGGACHSWDFDRNEQRICLKNILPGFFNYDDPAAEQ